MVLLTTSQLRSLYSCQRKFKPRATCNSLRLTGTSVSLAFQRANVLVPVGDRLFRSLNSTTISQVILSIEVKSITLITSVLIYDRGECVENCGVLDEKSYFDN